MKAKLGLICMVASSFLVPSSLMGGLALNQEAGAGQQAPPASQPDHNQKHTKRSPGKEAASGGADIGKGVGKGAVSAGKGAGGAAVDLATLHPIDAGASLGKGAAGAGKDVGVGSVKGTAKIGKGVGGGLKKLGRKALGKSDKE